MSEPVAKVEALSLNVHNYSTHPAATALVEKAHALLLQTRPETARWEDSAIWKERLATGKAQGYEALPSLNISIVGRHLSDPAKAEILGFSYGEYHPESQTAQSNYNVINPAVAEADRAAIQEKLQDRQLTALRATAQERGLEVKALFEELPAGIAPSLGSQPVNFGSYVTAPWFDYGKTEAEMQPPLKGYLLHVRGVDEELTPEHIQTFLDSQYKYNSTHPMAHFTQPGTPQYFQEIAAMQMELEQMAKGQRVLTLSPVAEAQQQGKVQEAPAKAVGQG
jgi:hypothetical protein